VRVSLLPLFLTNRQYGFLWRDSGSIRPKHSHGDTRFTQLATVPGIFSRPTEKQVGKALKRCDQCLPLNCFLRPIDKFVIVYRFLTRNGNRPPQPALPAET